MIAAAILAASLTLGVGGILSSGLGEQDASPEALARIQFQSAGWRVEVDWSGADKVTPTARGGWLGGVALDRQAGPLIIGLAYRHRVGEAEPGREAWRKETVWLRAGVRLASGGVEARILADSALTSRDRQSSLRAVFALPIAPRLALEPEARVLLYDQGSLQPNRRVGYTVTLRLLWALGGAR